MATVLVTGGAGYIGSHACKRLAAMGHTPVCLDNFATGWRDAVRYGPLAEVDLVDAQATAAAVARIRPDAVMHFAAFSLVAQSVADPGLYWRNNLVGSLNLLQAMVAAGVEALVFSSTAAVYGDVDAPLITEGAPMRPSSPYGATKLAVERLIGDFATAHRLRPVIFRYFNVAGADPEAQIGECHRPETHLVPLALEAAVGSRPALTVFGDDYPTPDGTCVRDYVHVEDLIDAHILGLERLLDGGGGLSANLGTGRGCSVSELIAAVRQTTGREVPFTIGPRRPGDPVSLVCDGGFARETLGWRPTRSDIRSIVRDAWRWSQGPGFAR